MKRTIKNMLGALSFLGIIALTTAGCEESHYYHTYHHHTHEWYDRHHTPPPAGVDFNVDIRH